MPVYTFKTIGKVPPAKEFIDIILSKTQRKTPTVVRRGWKISRVRSFYMRKVKYTQTNYAEKLTRILDEFPRLDDIHPFYADLVNVLYSRDHYKLALGQVSTARQTIDTLGKDYLRMLKLGDSLYRCKQLKRAAMGRMCTCMKKLTASLNYLEQVRQHLSRLPSIDPDSRTLMITGYPNVGKSSFINQLSRADVDVQPYAFTTKSLFVGHCYYKHTQWQVIDTPGILDHPLEDRNTIEMQAITALAHLQSTVLYFIDISEACGYTIKQQVSLFHSIKPLFQNKPLLIVANKIDLKPWDSLDAEDKALILDCAKAGNTQIIQMSNQTGTGIHTVKETACNMLLLRRVERKLNSTNVDNIANRLTVVRAPARDRVARPTNIPATVRAKRRSRRPTEVGPKGRIKAPAPTRQTLKAVELMNGGAGVFNFDIRHHWQLKNDDWKFDAIPEIMDGHNVADFLDPDIEARLQELEEEEARIEAQLEAEGAEQDMSSDLDDEEIDLVSRIRTKKALAIQRGKMKNTSKSVMPRTVIPVNLEEAERTLQDLGLDTGKFRRRALERVQHKRRRPSDRMEVDTKEAMEDNDSENEMEDDEDMTGEKRSKKKVKRDQSLVALARSRSASRTPRSLSGMRDSKSVNKAEKKKRSSMRKPNSQSRKGTADRHVPDLKPKHLYSGKRPGHGTADWR